MKFMSIALLLIFTVTVSVFTENALNNARWISANSGLKMRESPDLNAKLIVVIPYQEKVTLLEEKGEAVTISGATGKWSRVQWQSNKGWVFGGFLSTAETGKTDQRFIWGDDKSGYYSIEYPVNEWDAVAFANSSFYGALLTLRKGDTAIYIPHQPMGPGIVKEKISSRNIGRKKNIPVTVKEISTEIHPGVFQVIIYSPKENCSVVISIENYTAASIPQADMDFFYKLADTIQEASKKEFDDFYLKLPK